MAGPVLPNIAPLIAAGIDPKTRLPAKFMSGDKKALKENVKKFLRLVDEQDAVNRYVWYNLPCNLSSQELERMLYYRGQLCFFYNEETDEFYFMPYTLDGTIDFYGRYNRIHPVPFTNGKEEKNKDAATLLSQKKLNCVYGIKLPDEVDESTILKSAVLLHDYTKQLSQEILPRVTINDPLLDTMAECVPLMRTNLIASAGVKGVRVQDSDQSDAVTEGASAIEEAAMSGETLVPMIGTVDFQDLAANGVGKSEEYMLAMQSLDNLRLSGYGIDNGGLFEKKAHELQSEADINGGPVGLVLQDGLSIRQNFCNIVNSIWGIGIWCEPAENIINADANGDGVKYDRAVEGKQSNVERGENPGGSDNDSNV